MADSNITSVSNPIFDLPFDHTDLGGYTIEMRDSKLVIVQYDGSDTPLEAGDVEEEDFAYLQQMAGFEDWTKAEAQAIADMLEAAYSNNRDLDEDRRDREDREERDYTNSLSCGIRWRR